MLTVLWFVVRHLGAVLLLGWVAAALGARLLRGLRHLSRAEALGVRTTVGLAALGTAGFVLGVTGLLIAPAAALLLAAALLWSWREALELGRDLGGAARVGWNRSPRRFLLVVAAFALVIVPMLALSLYPPVGYDAINYHLPYVRAFVEHGALVTVDTVRFPVFPQLNEMLFTLMALLVDDVAAQGVQLLPTILVALLLASWAARIGGRSSGPWAAALWLGNPLVVWMSGQAYVDLGLTLFVVAGFVCLERFRLDRVRAFLWLGGALLGAACSVKYLGIFALSLGVAHAFGSAPPGRRARHASLLLVAAAAVAAPWYLRIAWETGNPVFPYFHDVFGGADWWHFGSNDPESIPLEMRDELPGKLGERFLGIARQGPAWLLALPVTVTWARELFGQQAPHTPWTVLLVVAIVWGARRDLRLFWLLAGSAVYALLLLYTTARDLRFLLPAAAALAAGGAVALRPAIAAGWRLSSRLERGWAATLRPARRLTLVVGISLAFLAPGVFYGGYKLRERGPPPLDDPEARYTFLARWVPAYRAVAFLDREHREAELTVYGTFGPVRYYCNGSFLGEQYGTYRQARVLELVERPRDVHALLRSWGVDYLLVGASEATGLTASPFFRTVYRDDEALMMRLADLGAGSPSGHGPDDGFPFRSARRAADGPRR